HALSQLGQGQRRSRGFADHDVQEGVEIAAADLVRAREVAAYAIRLRCDRSHVGRQLPLQLSSAGRWIVCAALGHLLASFIRPTSVSARISGTWPDLPRVRAEP